MKIKLLIKASNHISFIPHSCWILHEPRDAYMRVLLIEVSSSFVGTLGIGRNIGPVGKM